MLPAHERLHGHDLVGAQRDLGLEVQHELAPAGRASQGVLDLGPAQHAGLHVVVELLHGAAATLTGQLAGRVGVAEELIRGHRTGLPDGQPDRCGEEHLRALDGERIHERSRDALSGARRRLG